MTTSSDLRKTLQDSATVFFHNYEDASLQNDANIVSRGLAANCIRKFQPPTFLQALGYPVDFEMPNSVYQGRINQGIASMDGPKDRNPVFDHRCGRAQGSCANDDFGEMERRRRGAAAFLPGFWSLAKMARRLFGSLSTWIRRLQRHIMPRCRLCWPLRLDGLFTRLTRMKRFPKMSQPCIFAHVANIEYELILVACKL